MKIVKFALMFAAILLTGCSSNEMDRISIVQDGSFIAYVPSMGIVEPYVCLKNNETEMDPFYVEFKINDDSLQAMISGDPLLKVESKSFLRDKLMNRALAGKPFCVGTNLMFNEEIGKEKLLDMNIVDKINVVVTDADGKVIALDNIEKFVIGKPDGSVVEP